jgi:hypothetical protein
MKFTLWDQLVLNLTGRLPKKTQEEVDALTELKQFIARATEADHRARLAAAEKKKSPKPKGSTLDLLEPTKAPSKKKATPKKKKPSLG